MEELWSNLAVFCYCQFMLYFTVITKYLTREGLFRDNETNSANQQSFNRRQGNQLAIYRQGKGVKVRVTANNCS